jgi:hypothetical protein
MDQRKTLSYKAAFKFAFNTLVDHFGFYAKMYLLFAVLYFIIVTIFASIAYPLAHRTPSIVEYKYLFSFPSYILSFYAPLSILLSLIIAFIIQYYIAKIIKSGLAYYSSEQSTLLPFNTFITYFIARFWYVIKMIVGFLLLIIPGIYIRYKYYFTGFSILDKGSSISEDSQLTTELTQNVKWQLFLFDLLRFALIVMLFAGPFTFFLYPFFGLVEVHLYKQLLEHQQKNIVPLDTALSL